MSWKVNDNCYFVENTCRIVPGVITKVQGDFCVVKYKEHSGIRLRTTRLFRTVEEAKEVIRKYNPPQPPRERHICNPYMYDH